MVATPDDAAIREAVVRLIDQEPDKKEGRVYIAFPEHENADFIITDYLGDMEYFVVHASCELEAFLAVADNIVNSTSGDPMAYGDIFGDRPTERSIRSSSGGWCHLMEMNRETEKHLYLNGSGRSTKRARETE